MQSSRQSKAIEAEIASPGYNSVWAPKAKADDLRNATYDNLAKCQRWDVAFCYANGKVSQIGLVEQTRRYCSQTA